MSYEHLIRTVLGSCWAIEEGWLQAIIGVLNRKIEMGGRLNPEQIAAEIEGQQYHAALDGSKTRAVAEKEGSVAVLPLYGVISNRSYLVQDLSGPRGSSAEMFSGWFQNALNDPDIKAIVIDVNSPGGTVGGVAELSSEIFEARGDKPIIAQVNSMAASAAYWIASAADEMVVTPSSEVGSIGVWTMHSDYSKFLENEGINPTLISAGKYKVEGHPYGPLEEEAKAAIQDSVDHYYTMFVDAVARNRGVSADSVRSGFGEGRMVAADAAVQSGMADRVDTMRGTLSRLGVGSSKKSGSPRQKSSHHKASARTRELELLSLHK